MYIGVDIGGTKILVAAADASGQLIESQKITSPQDAKAGLAEIVRLIHQLTAGETISRIAVAAPGRIDRKLGLIISAHNLPHWSNTPIGPVLEQEFKVPVMLENDANAAALAEATIGAAQDVASVLYVTISTGIGTGVVLGGAIYHGAADTEGGHITIDPAGPPCSCGGRGHFEAITSGRAIEARFGRIAAEINDPASWDLIARDIALGLMNLIMALSPATVVLGGGVSVHYAKFQEPLMRYLAELATLYPLPKIVQAKYTEMAAVHGALILAREAA
ncbi:MAG TPA: ROK family protein [Candidatus Saccharimonadales bacterium]|nr:ROK family protein [Candidatus Saccharimonadales bacterium]